MTTDDANNSTSSSSSRLTSGRRNDVIPRRLRHQRQRVTPVDKKTHACGIRVTVKESSFEPAVPRPIQRNKKLCSSYADRPTRFISQNQPSKQIHSKSKQCSERVIVRRLVGLVYSHDSSIVVHVSSTSSTVDDDDEFCRQRDRFTVSDRSTLIFGNTQISL